VPLFITVVMEQSPAGTVADRGTRSSTSINIEIGDAVVDAAALSKPAWLRDVLRAVTAAT